ncbi:MAG: shikimate dehydrogenase [Desulfobacteraceae bacterium]|jgi:shikimate dehydrogenase|nr:shikimate dehydrogenase [Desulfobacteraceae bacterium]
MSISTDRQTPIDTQTKLVGLIGRPLGHSFSPAMHNRAFQALGLNYCYLPIEVTAEDLATVAAGIAKMNFAGYNVTIPHKIRIMDYLDAIDPLAQAIGAVNTVTIRNGRTTGYNTDGIGFAHSLETAGEPSVKNKSVLIVGAGGAARAIAITLADRGAARIIVCNRTGATACALSRDVNRQGRECATAIPLDAATLANALQDADILINTTSVGMHPQEQQSPIPDHLIQRHLVVCDIVYNPPLTHLLKMAQEKGCRIVRGIGMLVHQGAASFRLWTGRDAPVDIMRKAIRS